MGTNRSVDLAIAEALGSRTKVKDGKYLIEEFDGGGYRWYPLPTYFSPNEMFKLDAHLRRRDWVVDEHFCTPLAKGKYQWYVKYENKREGLYYSADSLVSEIDARIKVMYMILTGGKELYKEVKICNCGNEAKELVN